MSVLMIVRRKLYVGRVACCLLASHVEYSTRDIIRLEKRRRRPIKVRKKAGQTDRRTVTRPKHYAYR